ncbi:mitochondrial glycoprotein [Rhodofomes roseus]|uniref:Mitochondrial glycoprotein n=1 Tax=Rhodofomes roseus TaxID=34475 RepID=A0ABQ8KEP2_9APHY|nr:mitochondrial glycoprotein [Rhodofomes roseus]KAH9836103.1 mitochondrial glycoprotein [Rhodofomes roseus]
MSAIRALRHVSLSSSRAFAVRGAARSVSRAALPVFAARAGPVSSRAFSVSARRFGEGASDVALAQKLGEELQYEKDSASEAEPEFVRNFKAQGVWEIVDTPGNDEIALSRKFGNENIRLMFSVADIQSEQEADFEQGEEGEQAAEDTPVPSQPIRCSISVTKTGTNGAINVDALCQEGAFLVDNISFYSDAAVGTELTAEADWKRRGLYIGPQFDTLDVTVQEEFEQWLRERGITDNLSTFIPEYADYKEQKEYVGWLQQVKTFIEA